MMCPRGSLRALQLCKLNVSGFRELRMRTRRLPFNIVTHPSRSNTRNLSYSASLSTTKRRFYAVINGREGTKVYSNREEMKQNTEGCPGVIWRKFLFFPEAKEWLSSYPISQLPHDSSKVPSSTRRSVHDRSLAVTLSQQQKDVLEMVKDGTSIFLTGSAGTGKSHLLRKIIKYLHSVYDPGQLAVTASTGLASTKIKGVTLHSWAGIGLGKLPANKLISRILGTDEVKEKQEVDSENSQLKTKMVVSRDLYRRRWRKVKTLIIDEISMIDGVLFDKLEYMARVLRGNDEPFGGIQLIVSGDFYQLPPVSKHIPGVPQPISFAFDAESWPRCIEKSVILKDVFRQKNSEFVEALNEVRMGQLSEKTVIALNNLARTVEYDDGIGPSELFPTRQEVDDANSEHLSSLPGPIFTNEAVDIAGCDESGKQISSMRMESLMKHIVAPQSVTLKVGAEVMLIRNLEQRYLVNGSLGRVERFCTIDEASAEGMIISQCKDENGNEDEDEDEEQDDGYADHQVEDDDAEVRSWPVVRFENGRLVLCAPMDFEIHNASGEVEAIRKQVPLMLAYAISVHKAQGQTLPRVRVDLGRAFAPGQVYVALSRATSMETLEVKNFHPSRVIAHPRAHDYMSKLMRQDDETSSEDQFENSPLITAQVQV